MNGTEPTHFFRPSVTPATILVVEDEFVLAEGLRRMLSQLGYQVLPAAFTEEEAQAHIRLRRPDLVLLDIVLGDKKGGLMLAHALRYEYCIPFIFTTSHAEEEILHAAKVMHPYGYLLKPLRPPALYTAIEVALHKAAYEDVSRQEQEKRRLLDINTAVATIQNRHQLVQVLFERIRPLFPFDSADLALGRDADALEFVLLAASQTDQATPEENPVRDPSLAAFVLGHDRAERYALADLQHRHSDSPHIRRLLAQGVQQVMGSPLRAGGSTIGALCLHIRQISRYRAADLTLFQAVTNQLAVAISNVLAHEEIRRLNQQLQQEKAYLEEELLTTYNFEEMVGQSPALQAVFTQVRQVAKTSTTVLISGETGTGKELIARAIHHRSDRAERPLIKINCAALPPELIESELFGHEKGAFTGATSQRVGKFELAQGGTVFLDEVGELPMSLQSKLLRVLQEQEIERLGGNRVIQLDLRVLAATNRDLPQEVARGNFRADLYYRLSAFPISVPPLRERAEDIEALVQHFMAKKVKQLGRRVKGISLASLKALQAYTWPGNIRELEHIIERAIITGQEGQPLKLLPPSAVGDISMGKSSLVIPTLKEAECELIFRALDRSRGKVRGPGGAAQLLDINPSTLESRIIKLGIQKKHVVKEK